MVERGIAIFFAGSLMAMVIYHFILYLLYPRKKSFFYLALICLGVLLRTLTMTRNGIPLAEVFPSLSFGAFKRMEFFCVYSLIAVSGLYFHSLFPTVYPKRFLKFFVVAGLATAIFPIVTDFDFYVRLLNLVHLIYLFLIGVTCVALYRAFKARLPEATTTLIAMCIATPLIIVEIIANSGVAVKRYTFLLEAATLVFLLFQAFILARKNAIAYYLSEMTKADLEQAIAKKTEELSESNVLKNLLLSVMSHDVKTPLNSIKGILMLMNSNYIKPEEVRGITLQLEEQVQNTSILVENILHWSATQTRSITIKRNNIPLRSLVDECFVVFAFPAKSKTINFINDIKDDTHIIADMNVVKLVLRNLISNALKFSNEGGFIKVSYRLIGKRHVLSVEDNGIGIEKEKIITLFDIDRNVSSVGTKQEVGTGLGLSLCKKFLHAMGSEIFVESEPLRGTRFIIEIPVITEESESLEQPHIESRVA